MAIDFDAARERYHRDCAAAREAGRPLPNWWSYVGSGSTRSYASADDMESLASGDGSMWQV